MDYRVEMHETPTLMALAELRWVRFPSDKAKALAISDCARQGISPREIVDFFKANRQSGWFDGLRELKKGRGYLAPAPVRTDAVKTRSKTEIDAENARWAEHDRKPEVIENRGRLLAMLRAAGIRVENEERV